MGTTPVSSTSFKDPELEGWTDPVIEAYLKDVDLTLIRAMLQRTPEERLLTLQRAVEDAVELRRAMIAATARAE